MTAFAGTPELLKIAVGDRHGYPLLAPDESIGMERGDLLGRRLVALEWGEETVMVDHGHPLLRTAPLPLDAELLRARKLPEDELGRVTAEEVELELTSMMRRGLVDDDQRAAIRSARRAGEWPTEERLLLIRTLIRIFAAQEVLREHPSDSDIAYQYWHDGVDTTDRGVLESALCPGCWEIRSSSGRCSCTDGD